jgi:AraC-like DNA-binding protein
VRGGARAVRRTRRLADIAVAAGYADQSHLVREFQQLAGTTPTEFVARLMPGGGLLGDGCPPAVAG